MTCACGDPAQQVWFTAWPAWAIAHLHSPFFSGAVNVPNGANLLSNTSGTLVGMVLAPVTWLVGPVFSTNVALTLAPALSAWGCWVAARRLVTVKVAAIPAGLLYGYSAAVVDSLVYGHVSLTVLAVPPLIFSVLHEIVIRQQHSVRRDDVTLAALAVVQFLISPEVLVMTLLLAAFGLAAAAVVGWRQIRRRATHALPALAIGTGISVVLLAYPAWYGLHGPQSVSGVSSPSDAWSEFRSRGSSRRVPTRPRPTSSCASAATSATTGRRPTTSAPAPRCSWLWRRSWPVADH